MNSTTNDNSHTGSSTTKRPKKEMSKNMIEDIEQHLRSLPTRQVVTLETAIKKLKPTIQKLKVRGYSMDEVAAELSAGGLVVSARTLTRYLRADAPKKRVSAVL